MQQQIFQIILALFLGMCLTTPAAAKHDKDKDHGRQWEHADKRHDRILISLDEPRIVTIRSRLQPYYVRHCPPGLAKKHNGCLPPGHAKRYIIGQPLPYEVVYWDVPPEVITLLPAAPYGTRYVWVDKDVLLISEASKKVLDAVVLLSAVD